MQGVKGGSCLRPVPSPLRTRTASRDCLGQSLRELYLNLGQEKQVLALATIKDRVSAVMRAQARNKPVLVWGDRRRYPYGEVVS